MDNRNFMLAIVLTLGILVLWSTLFAPKPPLEPEISETTTSEQASVPGNGTAAGSGELGPPTGSTPDIGTGPTDGSQTIMTRDEAVRQTDRVTFDNPRMFGSITLKGGLFDDVELKNYREELDPESPPVNILAPRQTDLPFFAEFGWIRGGDQSVTLPNRNSVWTPVNGRELTPTNPLTLEWNNNEGLLFRRKISVDEDFLFSVQQEVINNTSDPVDLIPYAFVQRHGLPKTQRRGFILHEGFVGVFGETSNEKRYEKVKKELEKNPRTDIYRNSSANGWVGITDKYWLAAIIPAKDTPFVGEYRYRAATGGDVYQSSFRYETPIQITAGQSKSVTNFLFAGAKKRAILDHYQNDVGFSRFDLAIDWGFLWFITRPMFRALEFFGNTIGNFGVSILIVTVLIKIIFFWFANKSYEAMSRMKKLQPKMADLRERYKNDKPRQQQELMGLYKKEKVNPAAGCLPILIQIPVFFALYKVLFVTIEMRHAPFVGWIKDLSAPDPTTIFNLFGLLPFDPSQVPYVGQYLGLGVWPLVMGFMMFLQMKLNPPPADPMQQRIFNLMPIMFTFLLATFPAGLVIYWTWNNFLSVVQQSVIMKRMGVEIKLMENIGLHKVGKLATAVYKGVRRSRYDDKNKGKSDGDGEKRA